MLRHSLVAALLLVCSTASAQRLKFTIDDPNFKPIPIAVTEAIELAPGSRDMGTAVVATLRSDLDFSLVFTSLNPKAFLTTADKEAWTAPKFADWTNVGASGVVRTGVAVKGDRVTTTFRYFDVVTQKEMLTKMYETNKVDLRTQAHEFADELIAMFTGDFGVFSTRIAFAARSENNGSSIYVMDFDGQNLMKLPLPAKLNLLPSWAKTGRDLYFTSYGNDNPDLFAVDIDTKKVRSVSAQRGINSGASTSPDGSRIALTLSRDGNSEIYAMPSAGGTPTRLTDNWWIDTSPTYSPDGKQIAYVSAKTGNPHIYVMDADGGNQTRITFQGNYNQTPDWSPRGNAIAFTARDERFRFDIFTVDPATKEIKRLTQDQGNNEEPTFSPDGRLIAFVSDRSGQRRIWVMNADGTKQRQVYNGSLQCDTPSWGPRRREKTR
jgi:TolB protein